MIIHPLLPLHSGGVRANTDFNAVSVSQSVSVSVSQSVSISLHNLQYCVFPMCYFEFPSKIHTFSWKQVQPKPHVCKLNSTHSVLKRNGDTFNGSMCVRIKFHTQHEVQNHGGTSGGELHNGSLHDMQ